MAYQTIFFAFWESRKPTRVGIDLNFKTMEFVYDRLDICILLDNLKNEEIRKTLAYMVDFKEHDDLVVIPKPHSIEISNAEVCIAVIVFSGFEKEEYRSLKIQNQFKFCLKPQQLQNQVLFQYLIIYYYFMC